MLARSPDNLARIPRLLSDQAMEARSIVDDPVRRPQRRLQPGQWPRFRPVRVFDEITLTKGLLTPIMARTLASYCSTSAGPIERGWVSLNCSTHPTSYYSATKSYYSATKSRALNPRRISSLRNANIIHNCAELDQAGIKFAARGADWEDD